MIVTVQILLIYSHLNWSIMFIIYLEGFLDLILVAAENVNYCEIRKVEIPIFNGDLHHPAY
ncbi:hypothetical protein NQ314_004098 [Rhamnusium bicolor]|uniref:Uncharacterized protein n=1 Tax=Rhamnusium bicolor TaxID=1586634 RepID=A0AAV8ZN83_9CUCU|nr:hypothetical protein NQ314_004098 [Rhamnusium bicolor]